MDYAKIRERSDICRKTVRRCETEIDHLNSEATNLAKKMNMRTREYIKDVFGFLEQHRIDHIFDIGEDNIDMSFPAGKVISYDIVDVSPVKGSDRLITPAQRGFVQNMTGAYLEWMDSKVTRIDSLQNDSTDFLDEILGATVVEFPFEVRHLEHSFIFLRTDMQEFYLSCEMAMLKGLYEPLGNTNIHRNSRPEEGYGIESTSREADILVCYNPSIIVTVDTPRSISVDHGKRYLMKYILMKQMCGMLLLVANYYRDLRQSKILLRDLC